jgi:hypothetical protein
LQLVLRIIEPCHRCDGPASSPLKP